MFLLWILLTLVKEKKISVSVAKNKATISDRLKLN